MRPQVRVFTQKAEAEAEWLRTLHEGDFDVRDYSEADFEGRPGNTADLVILRLDSDQNVENIVARLRRESPAPIILIQGKEAPDLASVARSWGVSDYLHEPVAGADLLAAVYGCLAEPPSSRKAGPMSGLTGGERMVGSSLGMHSVRTQLAKIAATDCNVLITGETGTGKELAAELVHRNSRRRNHPFICINCAAIPETLLESELFGYEKGAFTGALSGQPGQLELANGGTIFLDEIGELSLHAQAKILRAIESKEVQRLGRRTGLRVDVRIVCATNRDLQSEVKKGLFRADLLFRVNVAHLQLPPLRQRKEDLRELSQFYFGELNGRMGLQVAGFTPHSWRSLIQHDWPGNVREFKNVIEASMVQIPFPRMRLVELPAEFHHKYAPPGVEATESEKLLAALECHNWNKSEAAKQLRWSRMTLYRKMAKYQLLPAEKARTGTA